MVYTKDGLIKIATSEQQAAIFEANGWVNESAAPKAKAGRPAKQKDETDE